VHLWLFGADPFTVFEVWAACLKQTNKETHVCFHALLPLPDGLRGMSFQFSCFLLFDCLFCVLMFDCLVVDRLFGWLID
jgi:hypothetical protein